MEKNEAISWNQKMKNEDMLKTIGENRTILETINKIKKTR